MPPRQFRSLSDAVGSIGFRGPESLDSFGGVRRSRNEPNEDELLFRGPLFIPNELDRGGGPLPVDDDDGPRRHTPVSDGASFCSLRPYPELEPNPPLPPPPPYPPRRLRSGIADATVGSIVSSSFH